MTPTPEQMQEFKEWYYGVYGNEGSPVGINHTYDLCTAYHQHCVFNDPGFQSNAELKRKLAALQEEVLILQESLATMTANRVIEANELRQQLTASQERCKELERVIGRVSTIHEERGIEGYTYGDTGLDSIAYAKGFNNCRGLVLHHVKKYNPTNP